MKERSLKLTQGGVRMKGEERKCSDVTLQSRVGLSKYE